MPTTLTDIRLDREARLFSERIGELVRIIQFRDRDRACCHDVSVSQCYALEAVVDAGPLTVNDLAAELYLDKSTASRVAQGLEEKGYVARERDAADGRVVMLRATAAGLELCARIRDDLSREYAGLLEDFPPEVRSAVLEVLGRLTRSFAARVEASNGSCCVVKG